MTAEVQERAQRRDRSVSWVVVGITLIALILGWFVKTAAEGRTVLYEADGLNVRYPADWVRAGVQSPALLQVEDRWAVPYRTTLRLERRPVPAGVPAGGPAGLEKILPTIQNSLALERGRGWTAYRVLRSDGNVEVSGTTGMHITFAYVETNPNPFLETVPVVMYGEDYLFPVGDQVYVATLTAAEANYAQAQKALSAFLRSLEVSD